jgi:hypothetical protein
MRHSFASYQKLIDSPRDRAVPPWETFADALQFRLDDWYTACICKTHNKFSRHANDIFPQEIKMLAGNNHGGNEEVHQEDHESLPEEVSSEEDEWYGSGAPEVETSGGETDEGRDQ